MPSKPTVMKRLGLTRRGPLRMIPTNEGERRLTAAEVRAMKLARMDYIGQQADNGRNEALDARRHVSLMRRHGRVRIRLKPEGTNDGRPLYGWEHPNGNVTTVKTANVGPSFV